MAVANRTAQVANSGAAAATSLVITKPAGTVARDVLLATISINGGTGITVTPPAGWTLLLRTNSTTVLGQAVYFRVADGSEGASFTFTVTSCFCAGVIDCYSGVDNKNPIAGLKVLAKTTASTAGTFGSIIPQSETCYGVLCATSRNTTAVVAITTPSTGYTTDGDTCTTATNFIQAAVMDQHATYGLPLTAVTPASTVLSTTSTDIDLAVFLRPDIGSNTGLASDVATFAQAVSGPLSALGFGTGYVGEKIFAFVGSDGAGLFNETCTVTSTTLSWSLVVRENNPATAGGCAEVWQAIVQNPLALNSEIVTVTSNVGGAAAVLSLHVMSFINCSGAGASAAGTNASGAPSLALTTSRPNSWVYGKVQNVTNATSPTVPAGQTLIATYLPTGEGYWLQRGTAMTVAPASVTINDTAPAAVDYNMVVVEIMTYPFGREVSDIQNSSASNMNLAVTRGAYF